MATHGLPSWPWHGTDPADLPEAERLLLDALRAWAEPGPGGPVAQAALLLTAAGLEAAALPLDAALRALPGLRAACPLCPRLNESEGALLLAVAAAQRGRRGVALALLHRLAPPLAAYQAMSALLTLACTLKHNGTLLQPAL
jgi:hypothetical protein